MTSFQTTFATCFTFLALCVTGCTVERETAAPETSPHPPTVDTHTGHVHPTEGLHHGDLIELGNDEYHAELVHNEQSVTIYILNGAADKQIPIEATALTINTKHNGEPAQFKLAALPDQIDPPGQSSRFISNDANLAGHIDEHGAELRLVLTIHGKSYRGLIAHSHDHEH